MIEQELGNLLPFKVPFATLLTMVEVDGNDPAFKNPTKFVGPVYEKAEADRLARSTRRSKAVEARSFTRRIGRAALAAATWPVKH